MLITVLILFASWKLIEVIKSADTTGHFSFPFVCSTSVHSNTANSPLALHGDTWCVCQVTCDDFHWTKWIWLEVTCVKDELWYIVGYTKQNEKKERMEGEDKWWMDEKKIDKAWQLLSLISVNPINDATIIHRHIIPSFNTAKGHGHSCTQNNFTDVNIQWILMVLKCKQLQQPHRTYHRRAADTPGSCPYYV